MQVCFHMSIVVPSNGRSHEQTRYLYVRGLIENTDNQDHGKKIDIGRLVEFQLSCQKQHENLKQAQSLPLSKRKWLPFILELTDIWILENIKTQEHNTDIKLLIVYVYSNNYTGTLP